MPFPHAVSPDSHFEPRHVPLVFGVFALFLAAAGTLSGKSLARSGMVSREEQPMQFWGLIVGYYLGGIFFIGCFLYETYGPH